MTDAITLLPAGPPHVGVLSRLHGLCFAETGEAGWDAEAFTELLAMPGACGVIAARRGEPLGLVLARAAGGDAEIVTLGVDPAMRRHGVAQALLAAAMGWAGERGAQALFLEVAADNRPAIALYEKTGFCQVGRRPGYYRRRADSNFAVHRVDALVMKRDVNHVD